MLNSEYIPHPDPMYRAKWLLASAVEQALAEARSRKESAERIVRVTVEVAGGMNRALSWMRAQGGSDRSYWTGRDGSLKVASVGAADVIRPGEGDEDPHRRMSRMLATEPGGTARYHGGMRFDETYEAAAEWRSFGDYRFVLPRFEMREEGGRCELSCNLVLPRDLGSADEIFSAAERLASCEDEATIRTLPALVRRADTPDYEGWRENIERALDLFDSGEAGKVVLARRARHVFEEELNPARVMESLEAATPGCFHFYFEPEDGVAFLGATPERLYRRDGNSIRTEAVAGTRPRGDSSPDDEDLRDDLMGSEKDLAEQRYVRDGIVEDLGSLCASLNVEEGVSEMKLASRRHLVSRFGGKLKEGVTDGDVLAAINPTPAVGGYPKEVAKAEIRNLEGFDRGWYAGPVGWISRDSAEFAVGIRSGLLSGRELSLYSGAGIVSGSTPEGEWAEIEQKIADFVRVLGLEHSEQHAAH